MNPYQPIIFLQYCFDSLTQIPIPVLLYTHIPSAVIAIIFSSFVYYKSRDNASFELLLISIFFSIWSFLELSTWFAFMGAYNTMFTWSLIDLVALLFFFASCRFLYSFIWNRHVSTKLLSIGYLLILPTAVIVLLGLNLTAFNVVDCEAVEDPIYTRLAYVAEALFILSTLVIGLIGYRKTPNKTRRPQIILATISVFLFQMFFFTSSFIVTLLIENTTIANPYNYGIYGVLGVPTLLVILGYLIVKFRSFNIKLIGAQALVSALVVLVASLLTFERSVWGYTIIGLTLFMVCLGGFFLVRSVKKEIKQREELELLTQALEKANVRLKELDKQKSEFVSIASHQLRSPLTSMRGYASMLVEGSFGKIPEKALEAAKRIEDSAKLMAMSVEDYLNVSRIESGNMKYNLSDFNVQEMTDKLCDDLRPEALKQNLILLFRSNITSRGIVNADVGKTNQIIHNLINNSIKYTPKGTINVFVRDDIKKKRIYIDITDTGIGMSQETQHTLFQKFSRAENANSVNVSGTGLGLYVAFKMAEAMGGTITCKSEGDGKGSTFTFELPLGM